MDYRHLELLREIAARGTLAAVAKATHRSPSAVSQQLRAAEKEWGVPLVEPFSRSIRLTPEGELLASGAEVMSTHVAALRAQLDARRGAPSGTVVIGTLPSAGEALLPGLIQRLSGTQIRLELDDFDLAEADFAARAHDADIVIAHSLSGSAPAGTEQLESTVIGEEPVVVALPSDHPMASVEAIGPHEATQMDWIGVPEGYPFDSVLRSFESRTGKSVPRRLRLRDNRLVEALVVAGVGPALLPGFTTQPRSGMMLRPLTGVRSSRQILALSRPDRRERLVVRTVVELLSETAAELSRSIAE